jgi:hypothetical protein
MSDCLRYTRNDPSSLTFSQFLAGEEHEKSPGSRSATLEINQILWGSCFGIARSVVNLCSSTMGSVRCPFGLPVQVNLRPESASPARFDEE